MIEQEIQVKPLTDWTNEPTVYDLNQDYINAKSSHDDQAKAILHWRELMDISGKAKPKHIPGRSSVQPRLIRRQAEWRYASLSEPFLSSQKIFQVLPRTFEDADAARQNELLLNYQFSTKLNKVKFIDSLIRAVVNDGTGIVRLGWHRETVKEPVKQTVFKYVFPSDPQEQQQLSELYDQARTLRQQNPLGYEQIPEEIKAGLEYTEQSSSLSKALPVGKVTVYEDKVIENKPTIEILNPENVYIDPSCDGDLDKALFVIISFETNKAELVKSGLYKNLDKINWDGLNTNLNDGDHTSATPDSFNFKDTSRRKCIAYEYWGFYDIHGNDELVPIVATWVGNTMIRMETNPYPDNKLPFVVIPYLPIPYSVYGQPDAALLEENQKILGAVLRGMIDLLGSSANSQQGFAKGMLDAINKKKFLRGEDYEFNPTVPIQNGYIQHTFPEIPNAALNLIQLMNQDAEALTGVKSFSGGITGESYGQVASGVRGVLDASSKREMGILRRIAKGMSDIGNKIISMNYAFLSDKEVVRVTNSEFIPINKEDLKGNFDLIVDINTAEIDDSKASDLGFMLQTIGPNMELGITLHILAQIAELKRMPDLAESIRNYQPQPDPKSELETQKLQSEIALNQAKAQDIAADSQAKNVDTHLNVSGVKHQRDMEKQQAQAHANQQLEMTKALLKPRKDNESMPDFDAAYGYNLMSKDGEA